MSFNCHPCALDYKFPAPLFQFHKRKSQRERERERERQHGVDSRACRVDQIHEDQRHSLSIDHSCYFSLKILFILLDTDISPFFLFISSSFLFYWDDSVDGLNNMESLDVFNWQ